MDKEILLILNQVEPRLYWLLLKLFIVVVLALVAKSLIDNLVAYIMFRNDKDLGKWVHVRVRNRKGVIKYYNTRWIFVETEEGQEIISMKKWRCENWALLNNKKKQKSS